MSGLFDRLFLHYGTNPINQAIHHTCYGAVDDDGACDFEHIGADT